MKKWVIVLIGIILVSVIIIFNGDRAGEEIELQISEACFEENCFSVEIADNKEERAKGLMNREELCSECGMLFIYDNEGDYKFWMKNTLIPLDIIWLDSQFRVVHIANAVPCDTDECELYGPDSKKAQYILEINSGKSSEIGLNKGSELELVYS